MVSWLISWFSKEPYYANYERNLEKISQEQSKLQQLRAQRQERRSRIVTRLWTYGLLLWAISLAYAFWVQQLGEGVLSPQEHALRVAPALFLLPVIAVMHAMLGTVLGMGDKRAQAQLNRLHKSKKKMIEDLKEYVKFDKVLTIIKQYDPDQAPKANAQQRKVPSQRQQQQKPSLQSSSSQSSSSQGPQQQQLKKGDPLSVSVSNRLLPLFDRFAGFIGDNPGLLAELSHVKQALHEAQDRAHNAEAEVRRLQQEIASLKQGEQHANDNDMNDELLDTLCQEGDTDDVGCQQIQNSGQLQSIQEQAEREQVNYSSGQEGSSEQQSTEGSSQLPGNSSGIDQKENQGGKLGDNSSSVSGSPDKEKSAQERQKLVEKSQNGVGNRDQQ